MLSLERTHYCGGFRHGGSNPGTPGKSLMYTLNRTGPRMDPWAIPRVDLRIPDVLEPIRTACYHACSS